MAQSASSSPAFARDVDAQPARLLELAPQFARLVELEAAESRVIGRGATGSGRQPHAWQPQVDDLAQTFERSGALAWPKAGAQRLARQPALTASTRSRSGAAGCDPGISPDIAAPLVVLPELDRDRVLFQHGRQCEPQLAQQRREAGLQRVAGRAGMAAGGVRCSSASRVRRAARAGG